MLADESAEQAALLRSPNQIEAVMANLQKRDPVFQDWTLATKNKP